MTGAIQEEGKKGNGFAIEHTKKSRGGCPSQEGEEEDNGFESIFGGKKSAKKVEGWAPKQIRWRQVNGYGAFQE